jgi:hypothetical protein
MFKCIILDSIANIIKHVSNKKKADWILIQYADAIKYENLEKLIDWLIDWLIKYCLTSSEQYFIYILDENNFNNI